MKITVHTLIHAEAGIVAQAIEVEGAHFELECAFAAHAGYEKGDDYIIESIEHDIPFHQDLRA
jgi:hypothetical protein